jgi:excisionase family DNA binding protein
MTINEAAKFLLLSADHVCSLVDRGEIAGEKKGRCWDLDEDSVRKWKQQRPSRPEARGQAWRKGMILTRRQWKCHDCQCVNQKDLHRNCRDCGKPRLVKKV